MFLPLIAAALASAPDTRLVPGTVTIEQADGATDDATGRIFADAVQSALVQGSYLPLPTPSHSRYVAVVGVTREAHGLVTSGTRGSKPVAGIANWGAGVGMRLPKKDDQLRDLTVTRLTVTILLRSDQHRLWSGSAVTAQVDGTRAGAPEVVARKLADALMAQVPRTLDAPLSVP